MIIIQIWQKNITLLNELTLQPLKQNWASCVIKDLLSRLGFLEVWEAQFLYLHFFVDFFSVLFVKIRCEISEIRGTERLFIDMFGNDVQQPSP